MTTQSNLPDRMNDFSFSPVNREKNPTNMSEPKIPEGWSVSRSYGETVGPEITKQSHLRGDQGSPCPTAGA